MSKPPFFLIVFATVVALTVAAGIVAYMLATAANPTGAQTALFNTMEQTCKAGLVAILALLGGRSARS